MTKIYQPQLHGIVYEMTPTWSLYPNAGAPDGDEDWVTTAAMGIAAIALMETPAIGN